MDFGGLGEKYMKYGLVKKEEEPSFQSHLEGILELPLMVSVCLRITCKTNNAIFYTGEKIVIKTSLRKSESLLWVLGQEWKRERFAKCCFITQTVWVHGCEFLQCVQLHWLGNKLWLGSISNEFDRPFLSKCFPEKKPTFFLWQESFVRITFLVKFVEWTICKHPYCLTKMHLPGIDCAETLP